VSSIITAKQINVLDVTVIAVVLGYGLIPNDALAVCLLMRQLCIREICII